MAGATFGRKGAGAAEPVRRRAEFLVTSPPSSGEEMARRREAFLASERARNAQLAAGGASATATAAHGAVSTPTPSRIPGGKTTTNAYLFWLFLSGFSAHRFYLGRPLSAVLQTALWYVSLMFFFAGHAGAFYLMIGGWLWIIGDAFLIPNMVRQANEKVAARCAPAE